MEVESLADEHAGDRWRPSKAILHLDSRNTKTLVIIQESILPEPSTTPD